MDGVRGRGSNYRIPPNSSQPGKETGAKSQQLSPASLKLLDEVFHLKQHQIEVVDVQKGNQSESLHHFDHIEAVQLPQNILSALGIDAATEAILIIAGGLDVIEQGLDEIKKSRKERRKKLSKDAAHVLQELVGLTSDEVVIYESEDEPTLVLLETGLSELQSRSS